MYVPSESISPSRPSVRPSSFTCRPAAKDVATINVKQDYESHHYGLSLDVEQNHNWTHRREDQRRPWTMILPGLWVIWGQCCPRVAAVLSLPNGPITQLSPYFTRNPCTWQNEMYNGFCNLFSKNSPSLPRQQGWYPNRTLRKLYKRVHLVAAMTWLAYMLVFGSRWHVTVSSPACKHGPILTLAFLPSLCPLLLLRLICATACQKHSHCSQPASNNFGLS